MSKSIKLPVSERLSDAINKYAKIGGHYLITSEKTAYDSSILVEPYHKLRDSLLQMRILPVNYLPESILESFLGRINTLSEILINLESFLKSKEITFNVPEEKEKERMNMFVDKAKYQINQLVNLIDMHLPYLEWRNGGIEKGLLHLKAQQEQISDYFESIKETKKEIDKILTASHDIAAEAGIGHFTQDFILEAKVHKKNALWWLIVTGVFALLTLASAILLSLAPFYYKVKNPVYFQIMNDNPMLLITSKLTIILLLLTAALWCAKLYKSSLHLSVVNKHRGNALMTFQAFSQASSDIQAKNAVLMEASHCIFSASGTGLTDSNESSEQIKFLEIFKGINSTK